MQPARIGAEVGGYSEPVMVLAVNIVVLVASFVTAIAVAALVLLIWAPWKSVRSEPPLDEDVETRLLLNEDPEQIAADEDAELEAQAPVRDLDARRASEPESDTAFSSLSDLDDEPRRSGADAG